MRIASAILLVCLAGVGAASAETSTVGLSASVNPAAFGQNVTFTVVVSPAGATGKVTFYDGTVILGGSTLSSGNTTFSTIMLAPGARSIRAYYAGDATHTAASSPPLAQQVSSAPSGSFKVNDISVNWPEVVVAGDFNGDGKPDIVAATYYGLQVLLGNDDGTFRSGAFTSYSNGSSTPTLAAGDLNLDGKLDLVMTRSDSSAVVYLGNGDGTFQASTSYSAVDQQAYNVVVGDFNGDGKPDLAVSGYNTSSYGEGYVDAVVVILIGSGTGTFQTRSVNKIQGFSGALAIGDFNGDGKADIAVSGISSVNVILGNGDGTFQGTFNFGSGGAEGAVPGGIAVGDFNGDGKLDIVVGNENLGSPDDQQNLGVLLGNGNGTFRPAVTYASSNFPAALAVSDFNGDGIPDLAVANAWTSSIGILLGKGDGTFGPVIKETLTFSPMSLAFADFDRNGSVDIAAPSTSSGSAPGGNRISVLLGSSTPSFTVTVKQSGTVTQGQLGVVYTIAAENTAFNPFTGPVQLTYNLGTGLISISVDAPGWSCSTTPSSGTCSRNDSIASALSYPAITVITNVSPLTPYSPTTTATLSAGVQGSFSGSTTTTVLQTQTINFPAIPNHAFGDGSFNVNATSSTGLKVTLLSSGNCGVLGSTVTVAAAGSCTITASQPGDSYWASASKVVRTFTISGTATTVSLATSGTLQFGKPLTLIATISPGRTLDKVTFFDGTEIVGTVALVNGSASLTTSLLSPRKHSLTAYYGGIRSTPVSVTLTALGVNSFSLRTFSNTAPNGVAVGDFNGDGKADVVIATTNSAYLPVYLGNGAGAFLPAPQAYSGDAYFYPQSVTTGDFNGDGKTDLVLPYYGSGQYAILLGNGDGTFKTGVISQSYAKTRVAPLAVVVADVNGDGKADLLFTNSGPVPVTTSPTVDIALGNGDGTFGAIVEMVVPEAPLFMVMGDFNQDGKTDMALPGTSIIRIFLGNGDGTFQPPIGAPISGAGIPSLVSTGDFNDDGKLDIVLSGSILYGNGDGTFQSERNFAVQSGGTPGAMLIGDFTEDQKPDVVVVAAQAIGVIPGNGDGTFGIETLYANAFNYYLIPSAGMADFNGDGRPDIVTGAIGSSTGVLLGSASAALDVTMTHTGSFIVGQTNAMYSIAVRNAGFAATSGQVTVAASVGYTLSAQAISGTGWACTLASLLCTRNDVLAAGASYPAISILLNPPLLLAGVASEVSVYGGGSKTANSADFTRVLAEGPYQLAFSTQPSGALLGNPMATVRVQVQDAAGNFFASSSAAVTLTSTPVGVSATVNAVNGVATFTNLIFSAPGSYRLTASSGSLHSSISDPFTIVNSTYSVSGRVMVGGTGLAGVTVRVTGAQLLSALTDADGSFGFFLPATGNYTLWPARTGYTFSAPFTVTGLSANSVANFTGVSITGLQFYPVTPCRVADTRAAAGFGGPFGPPAMPAGSTRTFVVPSSACGIPATAQAYSLNFTVVPPGPLGNLTTWPTGQAMPNVSTLNDPLGTVVANAAIVPAGANGAISVYVTHATDVLFDINGYFAPPNASGLQFYPVAPCRVADTRPAAGFYGAFGPPALTAGLPRSFPVAASACGIPANAAAYSLNFTVVPPGPLGVMTTWPTGQTMPNASTLNSYGGGVVANAAIVPSGTNGSISIYVNNPTDVLFDINGYFAPPSSAGMNFYPVTPCRLADTRPAAGFSGAFGSPGLIAGVQREFPVPDASACAIPASAGAYSLNFTAVPPGPLGVLSIWPAGLTRPNASTLNSYNGSIVANAAIVPAGTNGYINVWANNATDLLFDVNGYFAQ